MYKSYKKNIYEKNNYFSNMCNNTYDNMYIYIFYIIDC